MDIINNYEFMHKLCYIHDQNKYLEFKACGEFETIWKFFSDDLNESGNYNFTSGMLKNYCPKKNCDSDINKIDAGCLWLFNKFYMNSNNFSNYANNNIDIVVYIMMWLGYKLNKMLNTQFSNINEFYNKHMKNIDEYNKSTDDVMNYKNYIDLINKKNEFMDIDINVMSTFYDLFKILCNMIINADKNDSDKKYLEYANKFADEYKKLFNDDHNNTKGSPYNQILSILSNEYTSYEKNTVNFHIRNTLPKLVTEKTPTQVSGSSHKETQNISPSGTPASSSDTTISDSDSTPPSSSILNKLILIPFIFVATLILLGIAYKYSLFGFRKRSQKQHIKEQLKK
ncbi:hypothetical protein YYC_02084 [Plasmodium yoelii 17X]|uniref:YIR protein n=1 Tax=Plasmodium yoelii 17X TaxID=1323249 RepID=V7PSQ4_PLAYE|nr:hypothetical protein YYC_02084 [Plasmodium yoelii 17X]